MNVWRKTCIELPEARRAGAVAAATAPDASTGGHQLSALDQPDRGGEDADAGVVEREVAEQTGVLGRADRLGELLPRRHVARLQRGEQDLRAVVGLGAVQFRLLVVLGLVGGGELLRRVVDVVAQVGRADDSRLDVRDAGGAGEHRRALRRRAGERYRDAEVARLL